MLSEGARFLLREDNAERAHIYCKNLQRIFAGVVVIDIAFIDENLAIFT